MRYFISYDLNKAGKNYDGLIERIKQISNGIWCTPCKSTWVIQSAIQSSKSVYEELAKEIDSDDFIIIAEITKNLFGSMNKEVADYLGKHFIQ